jgi:hypothetical protein
MTDGISAFLPPYFLKKPHIQPFTTSFDAVVLFCPFRYGIHVRRRQAVDMNHLKA